MSSKHSKRLQGLKIQQPLNKTAENAKKRKKQTRFNMTLSDLELSSVSKAIFCDPKDQCSLSGVQASANFDTLMTRSCRGPRNYKLNAMLVENVQVASLGRKALLGRSAVCQTTALEKWVAADYKLRQNTEWLRNQSSRLEIVAVRTIIKEMLGRAPSRQLVGSLSYPGPGVNTDVKFQYRHVWKKLKQVCRGKAAVYNNDNLKDYLRGFLASNRQLKRYALAFWRSRLGRDTLDIESPSRESELDALLDLVATSCPIAFGNEWFTVPKTAVSVRPACKEALLASILQKGLGAVLRSKLSKRGINLSTQPDYHRHLVHNFSGCIYTIDLSAASDSISLALIDQVIPADWLELIHELRAPSTLLPDGRSIELAKVSSMGNGFTFELETVLFYAITYAASLATGRKPVLPGSNHLRVSVFGDDIIIPADHQILKATIRTLTLFGFTVNKSKTHTFDSVIRESCGAFSIFGKPVPLVHSRSITTVYDVIKLRNQLYHHRDCPAYAPYYYDVDRLLKIMLRSRNIDYRVLFAWSDPEENLFSCIHGEFDSPHGRWLVPLMSRVIPTRDLPWYSATLKGLLALSESDFSWATGRLVER